MSSYYHRDLPGVVLIPYWISEALYRNELTIESVLDYTKLRRVLSQEDMVGLANAQCLLKSFVGADCNDYMQSDRAMVRQWEQSVPADQPDILLEMKAKLSLSPVLGQDVHQRLCAADRLERFTQPFKVVDLTNRVAGVVIYPGYFVGTVDPALQAQLVDALLKVFYVYSPYHDVAKSALFRRHLELLSGPYAK